jgi:CubicO group peptidase (beta-lactamase class C family)
MSCLENRIGFANLTLALAATAVGFACATLGSVEDRTSENFVDVSSDVGVRIDRYLTGLESIGFSGGIIVAHAGDVVLRKGYGLADREARHPNTPGTVHDILSVTKSFTAAAILLLESRGQLSTADPLTRYFDDVPADKQGITLHHLLTHQSGWGNNIGPDDEPIEAEAYVVRAMQTPLGFEPGARWSYSNVGYSLLGMIIERVSGRGYEAFVREELLLPAGMERTGYVLADWPAEAFSAGYRNGQRHGRTMEEGWLADGPGWHVRAGGGLHSTLDDMHRWLDVLRGRGPLAPEDVERWTTGYVDARGGDRYGYGWEMADTELGRRVAHSGGHPAFTTDFVWYPDRDLFFYVQGNNSLVRAAAQRAPLGRAAFDPAFIFPPAASVDPDFSPAAAAARAGEYRSAAGAITLTTDDIRLRARLEGQPVLDAMFGHDPAERRRFTELNELTDSVVSRIWRGREDALQGLVRPEDDEAARVRSLSGMLEQGAQWYGELRATRVIGTVANVPGRIDEVGNGYTTYVRLEYANDDAPLGLLWREDGSYRGFSFGDPVTGFVLVPVTDGGSTAIEQGAPWRTRGVAFDADCLVAGELRACR